MVLEKRLVVFGRPANQGPELDDLLACRGFQAYTVELEDDLLDVLRFSQPDVIVLAGAPDLSMLARVVTVNQMAAQSLIVVIQPQITPRDAVALLEMGVDYVSPSYQADWLAAQMHASLRRVGRDRSAPSVIELGYLRIDLEERRVTVHDREVPLTPTEFAVLRVLAERPGTVLPSGEIMQQVMGIRVQESEAQDLLKVHIYRLRQKLEQDPNSPRFIRTVRGHGYMYAFERRSRAREDEPAPKPAAAGG